MRRILLNLFMPGKKPLLRWNSMALACTSLLLMISVQSWGMLPPAADITVSGQVTSQEDGEPLPGVSVAVKGTSSGTLTDTEGRYTITVDEGAVLVFSFLGFQSQEIGVAGNAVIDVALVP